MRIKFEVIVFDAADLGQESRFWAGVLGGKVNEDDDWHVVIVDGTPRVGVQLAPGHTPPQWPDGPTKQQIHLDGSRTSPRRTSRSWLSVPRC